MKAISIRQPWAWLIISGIKPIENRTWTTKHRGPLLIHAARTPATTSIEEIERRFGITIDRDALQFGGIIGRVQLVDVVTKHASRFFEGPYGFVLRDPRRMKFVPCAGKLSLFEI